ncbi:MAG: DUF2974 domain-containing protein [Lachnospiraceae bacterium]|jgi:hypothetical protein|nr:DUF2974 domain-containing protein [Lachnospiraceae bacterium]
MSYSDDQMLIASQIAYFDFDESDFMEGHHTLRELLKMEAEGASAEKLSKIKDLTDRINGLPNGDQCWNWSIKNICNDEHGSGMYACTIDTADGDALIAFRGSESDTTENLAKDWGLSDVGLLNNALTPQQKKAQEYTREIWDRYGHEYNHFGFTGHSLGGNLAEHAGITAPDAMRDKIDQCVSLDGPGYSEKYLLEHAGDIMKAQRYLTHYQWSVVGTLLYMVPTADNRTIHANTPSDHDWLNMVWRHDTHNVTFDEHGNVISDRKDEWSVWSGPFSKYIDMSIFALPRWHWIPGVPGIQTIYDGWVHMQDIFIHWSDWIKERRDRYIGNVHFMIKPSAVNEELSRLTSEALRIRSDAGTVRDIERRLQFRSAAAGAIKCSLWQTANGLEDSSKDLRKYIDAGRTCADEYQNRERTIAGNLAASH